MMRALLAALSWLAIASPAFALNHTAVVNPFLAGPYKVACSNLAQDTSRMIAGATPTDYWEGNLVNERVLYIDQILAAPETTFRFDALVPDNRSIYPNTANTRVPFVAIVCYPTNSWNNDPDYALPGSSDVVPRMQLAGQPPKLIGISEYNRSPATFNEEPAAKVPLIVYSHGLGGSPAGKGYIASIALLATHGYMVAAVFHADARFSRLRVEDLSDYWYLLTQYERVAEMELMRPVALKAMTDALLAHPVFKFGIDVDRIGGFGASLGGQAMANLLGAKMTTSIGLACRETVRDPRIKVAVGFVPYAGQSFLPAFCDDQSGADEVTRPYLALSGTADSTAPIKMMRQALNRFKGSRYLVELVGGEHELRADDIGDLFTWMVTFYRAYLQDDAAAFARFAKMRGVNGGREDILTIDAHVPTSFGPGEVRATELHNDRIDRYFLESDPMEVSKLLAGAYGPGWSLTNFSFKAWAEAPAATVDACHFSNTFTLSRALNAECAWTKRLGRWTYSELGDFFIEKADGQGHCRDGLLEVNRLYHPRFALSRSTSNERLVTSDSEARAMVANGWILLPTTMCARP
jgi:hypothetical protein